MAAKVASFPAQVNTYLNYYLTPEQGGLTVTYPGTAGDKLRRHDSRAVRVQSLRSCEEGGKNFSLDRNGFQLVSHEFTERHFHDPERVKNVAYQETEDLLKKASGASKVMPFSHIMRRDKWEDAIEESKKARDKMDIVPLINPAMYCHVDQSYFNRSVMNIIDVNCDYFLQSADLNWIALNQCPDGAT